MPRAPDEKYKKAYDMYLRGYKLVEIASQLCVPEGTVRRWKCTHKWDNERSDKKANVRKGKKPGAPVGNKNAVGNTSSKPGNQKAFKHGLRAKYIPADTLEIIDNLSLNPLDILWDNICIAYAAIVRAQQISYVKDQKDVTTTQIGQGYSDSGSSEKWEVQQAWDKQSNFMKAQARAQSELRSMIKQYDELLKSELATEEQKLRIDKLKLDIKNADTSSSDNTKAFNGIPATMIAPAFSSVVFDIENREHLEYVFPGGRGSTKSSFISEEGINLLEKNPTMHMCVMRQVADTLRTSVYQQMIWAIEALGLSDEYHATVSPLEITKKSTGQKIYFRGADDPGKIKSIKVPFGYIGIAWFEELDQFAGPEAVRKIEQSVIRGGDIAYIFKSFNPPKSANNWANKYIKIPKENRLVVHSTYLDVPKQWLGKPFLDEAEFLKEVNPSAYENEYMGVANGSGGSVFDNVNIRAITDEEINRFDHILNGIDWGWYPDPRSFMRVNYEPAQHKLYIWFEDVAVKCSNENTSKMLKEKGITPNDLITCDSAEEKSVSDLRAYGWLARGAEKGPGSREYSYKWLQSLREIIIDNTRCPVAAEEFLNYEYDRDKDGNVISGYPDGNDHCIDAVRYATERIWKKRGQ